MIRIALISSTGSGRKRTLPALVNSEICKVVAIHGRDQEKLQSVADEFGVSRVYTDLKQLLKERDFDMAMICSPPFLHLEQVRVTLEAGIPTLVEKPLALNAADARKLATLAESNQTKLAIAHHLRHHPNYI